MKIDRALFTTRIDRALFTTSTLPAETYSRPSTEEEELTEPTIAAQGSKEPKPVPDG